MWYFFLILLPLLSDATIQKEGDFIMLSTHNSSIHKYWLKINNTQLRPLSFLSPPMGLQTGDRIRVSSSLIHDVIKPDEIDIPFYVENMEVLFQMGRKDVISKIYDVTSIAYVLNVCDSINKPVAEYKKIWFRDKHNLRDYHSNCSHGKVRFSEENNIIIGPIDVPCVGQSMFGTFDSSMCDSAAIYGWMGYGDKYATSLGYDLTKYTRRIALLPSMPQCKWAGLGSVGCSSFCYAWVQSYIQDVPPSIYFHELGHNLGLMHSSLGDKEYGDSSCAMGISKNVCFNSAHQWMLGWNKLVAEINSTNISPGKWETFIIPASQVSDKNVIRVVPNWLSTWHNAINDFFVSYRTVTGFDTDLGPNFTNTVQVHQSTNTLPLPEINPTKLIVFGNGKGTIITESSTGMVINITTTNDTHATVKICFKSETNCNDNLDNDCNGVMDRQESRCRVRSCKNRRIRCGDGICDAWANETCISCPYDCAKRMGNGQMLYCCGQNGCNNNVCVTISKQCLMSC